MLFLSTSAPFFDKFEITPDLVVSICYVPIQIISSYFQFTPCLPINFFATLLWNRTVLITFAPPIHTAMKACEKEVIKIHPPNAKNCPKYLKSHSLNLQTLYLTKLTPRKHNKTYKWHNQASNQSFSGTSAAGTAASRSKQVMHILIRIPLP